MVTSKKCTHNKGKCYLCGHYPLRPECTCVSTKRRLGHVIVPQFLPETHYNSIVVDAMNGMTIEVKDNTEYALNLKNEKLSWNMIET